MERQKHKLNYQNSFGSIPGLSPLLSTFKQMVHGKIEGKRLRGRSFKRWIDQVKILTDEPLEHNIRATEDQQK